MRAILRRNGFEHHARTILSASGLIDHRGCDDLLARLGKGGVDMSYATADADAVTLLARRGMVEFVSAGAALTLIPVREDFAVVTVTQLAPEGALKLSKFQYIYMEQGALVARSPHSDCYARIHDPRVLSLMARFADPTTPERALDAGDLLDNIGPAVLAALARAGVILPCDANGRTEDEIQSDRRMWDFHELLFHSRSRLGRAGGAIGATWELRDEIPQPPAIKENPWEAGAISLYRPARLSRDMTLFDAMETRRSVRAYSAVPLSSTELGEFLFRTMRIRREHPGAAPGHVSRPYPNGGGIYEQELYVTIDACLDIPRGFYYYDALEHTLCPVSAPCPDMEMMIEEAVNATARLGRPQILFTIASRFSTFNWKYSAMSYAAQLKNVGVIYQTMYLVATAMGIGGCGLGIGNSDCFAQLTGIDYVEEGSIGEFMIGRLI